MLYFRFTGGECYADLVRRLSSVVIDVEQQVTPTLVVSHLSILQCLMAYFRNTPVEKCTGIEVPMHTVIKFTPVRGGGWRESHHPMFGSDGYSRGMVTVSSESEFSQVSLSNNESLRPIWDDQMASTTTNTTTIRTASSGSMSSSGDGQPPQHLSGRSSKSGSPKSVRPGGGLPLSPHSRKMFATAASAKPGPKPVMF